MRRRDFLTVSGASLFSAIALERRPLCAQALNWPTGGLAWQQNGRTGLFRQVVAGGQPLARGKRGGLLDGFCRLASSVADKADTATTAETPVVQCGPVRIELTHRLLASEGGQKEDVLEATLAAHNTSDRRQTVEIGFQSTVSPCERATDQQIYLPISACGLNHDSRFVELGSPKMLQDCHQAVAADGFLCHYFEPLASDPRHSTTAALLLAPVIDIFHSPQSWRVAMFATSLEPTYFQANVADGLSVWRMGRSLRLNPDQRLMVRGYLHVHRGDASEAWNAFHRFGHHEDFAPIDWLREIRVHYFDFLSATDPNRRRGDGYDADLAHFGDFHVGMATQHGYYPYCGDYLNPNRKQWQAMVSDPHGAVTMSLEKIKARVQATRRAGVHPAIYLHMTLFDEGSSLYDQLKDSIVIGPTGDKVSGGWNGVDTLKRTWKMSVTSPEWRSHLLQQAQWIMELFDPDAIVMDETFMGLGYDHHPKREGPLSPGGIELIRKMRALVRSFGPNKAFLVSDCSMTNTVMWADGEVGDHAYASLLGQPLYRQSPVRYLAALGGKPWRPCAWNFQKMWSLQMELARIAGAGIGVSNGYQEFTGLTRLPQTVRQRMIRDIESLQQYAKGPS